MHLIIVQTRNRRDGTNGDVHYRRYDQEIHAADGSTQEVGWVIILVDDVLGAWD